MDANWLQLTINGNHMFSASLDLYLMHWPDANLPGKSAREARAETWKALEELYDRGERLIDFFPTVFFP